MTTSRWLIPWGIFVAFALLLTGSVESAAQSSAPALAQQVEILRTQYGVPHVKGQTLAAAAFGMGYCQAEDHLLTIMGQMISARGESAKYFGGRRNVERETKLDGIYVIRTSEPRQRFSAEDTVRTYKSLSLVEQAFRCLKGVDLLIRPIRHRTVDHVSAHVFLCTLAYYVEWHMRKALAPILFEDEELDQARWSRDPVAKAEPSASVKDKKASGKTADGFEVQSFKTLIKHLATRTRNECRIKSDDCPITFVEHTQPTPLQRRAYQLLDLNA